MNATPPGHASSSYSCEPSSDVLYDVRARTGRATDARQARADASRGWRDCSGTLREHGARVRLAMLKDADDGSMAILDRSGIVACWFARAGDFQREGRPVLGRHVEQFYVAADVIDHVADRQLEIAAACGYSDAEGWRLSAAGGRFWATTRIHLALGADGGFDGFVHVIRATRGSGAAARAALRRPPTGTAAHAGRSAAYLRDLRGEPVAA